MLTKVSLLKPREFSLANSHPDFQNRNGTRQERELSLSQVHYVGASVEVVVLQNFPHPGEKELRQYKAALINHCLRLLWGGKGSSG